MGYDRHHQSNSSGALIAVIGVGVVLAILAIIAIAAIGLFWVRSENQRAQAVAMEQRTIAELHRVGAEAQLRDAMAQLEQSRIAAASDPRLNFELNLDREGNVSVDGEQIGLDELKAEMEMLKEETSNVFRVRINADPECPIKLVVPVLDLLGEVGDIDYRIVSSRVADENNSAR